MKLRCGVNYVNITNLKHDVNGSLLSIDEVGKLPIKKEGLTNRLCYE